MEFCNIPVVKDNYWGCGKKQQNSIKVPPTLYSTYNVIYMVMTTLHECGFVDSHENSSSFVHSSECVSVKA